MVNFGSYVLHVAPGVLLIFICEFVLLKFMYRKQLKRPPCAKKAREIAIWKLTSARLTGHNGEEEIIVKRQLEQHIKELVFLFSSLRTTLSQLFFFFINSSILPSQEASIEQQKREDATGMTNMIDVSELEKKYIITDYPLFIKTTFILGAVIIMFFVNSFLQTNLSISWIALIGAMTLLILADVKDINIVLEKVHI